MGHFSFKRKCADQKLGLMRNSNPRLPAEPAPEIALTTSVKIPLKIIISFKIYKKGRLTVTEEKSAD